MGLCNLVSRLGEGRFDFIHDGRRLGLDKIFQIVGQRVRNGDQRKTRGSEHLSFGPAEGPELVAADDNGGNTSMLEFDAVVDTPRRAAASIGDGQHHRVACLQPTHHLGR